VTSHTTRPTAFRSQPITARALAVYIYNADDQSINQSIYLSVRARTCHCHLSINCQPVRELDLQPVDAAANHARARDVLHAPGPLPASLPPLLSLLLSLVVVGYHSASGPVPAEHDIAGQTTTARRHRRRPNRHSGIIIYLCITKRRSEEWNVSGTRANDANRRSMVRATAVVMRVDRPVCQHRVNTRSSD